MVDYNHFLRGALELRRDHPLVLGEEIGMRPRMLIISRASTCKLLNLEEVAAAAAKLGFNLTVAEASTDVPAKRGRQRRGELSGGGGVGSGGDDGI
ncbi:hypothetical protein GUJ93_ZPchr0002g24090 [Zizania palustris]|uniref:Uncharacterized protein n=1 Tax=Zizania palustris TaxID=103762 RepID=A0A8J5V4T0_ZIZPA|nr:hypothetical protein GUJ93_ZPchr0002g24090 [Zizania palustris]